MEITEKLRVMLPHWIEHNRGHADEFSRWAQEAAPHDQELASLLTRAVEALTQAQSALDEALTRAGGPLADEDHRHHHHHHHH